MTRDNVQYLDDIQKNIYSHFSEDNYLSQQQNVANVIEWIGYYRKHLGFFAVHYLGLKLHFYQYIILEILSIYVLGTIVGSRAIAKTYIIAVYSCCIALLYPNSNIKVVASCGKQSKILLDEKIGKELFSQSPILKVSVYKGKVINDKSNNIQVSFIGGSTITSVICNDNARGGRATVIIHDEFRMEDKHTKDSAIDPMTNTREAPFMSLIQYEDMKEPIKRIHISSSWFGSHWMWDIVDQAIQDFKNNKQNCFLAFDYCISLRHQIKTKEELINSKKNCDNITWRIEYENERIKQGLNSYFDVKTLLQNQTLKRAFYPQKHFNVISKIKNPYNIEKQEGEIRVISCDIAFVDNSMNDNSAFTLIRAIPEAKTYSVASNSGVIQKQTQIYKRQVVYIETHKGGDIVKQVVRIKQLFNDFNADYCVLDVRNGGIFLSDTLSRVIYDEERNVEYPAWCCLNDDNTANRVKTQGALPVLYSISATEKLNSDMAKCLQQTLRDNKMELLVNPNEAIDDILPKMPDYVSAITSDDQIFFERPYLETRALISEIVELCCEVKTNGIVKIFEQGRNCKDRYTSLAYGNFFINELENNLFSNNDNYAFNVFVN